MTTSIAVKKATTTDSHMRVTWVLVAGLFVLRIPFFASARIFSNSLFPNADWAAPIFEIGTYFLTAVLIWWERDRLADFHIDKLVLLIFILGKPVELLMHQLQIPFSYPERSAAYFLYLPIAVSLGVALWVAHPSLPKLNIRLAGWILIGILTGIAVGIYSGSIIKANSGQSNAGPVTPLLIFFLPLQQMLYAAIAEEPFFRGFLWGVLRKSGVNDISAWLIQAGLFWIGHAYYLVHNAAWSFLFIVPVGGLVLGLLAWRSRSIAVSMVAHGLTNGIGQIVGYYI
jgi:membrane protease YdiL (CAAX protease family)